MHIWAISKFPVQHAWGKYSVEGDNNFNKLTDPTRTYRLHTWIVGQLKFWCFSDPQERANMGVLPLREVDYTAAQDLIDRLRTAPLGEDEEPSPLVWASRWLRVKKGGPRVEFESVFDLREPVPEGNEIPLFPLGSLAEDDIVIMEAAVTRWKTPKGYRVKYELKAAYWIYRPEDKPPPAKKAKTCHIGI